MFFSHNKTANNEISLTLPQPRALFETLNPRNFTKSNSIRQLSMRQSMCQGGVNPNPKQKVIACKISCLLPNLYRTV